MTKSSPESATPFTPRSLLDAIRLFPSPISFSTRAWIIAGLLMLIGLTPLFFIPLGPDEAMFFVSGEKILEGAIHYRDIVDIKPPLIYHLYAIGIALFGHSDLAIQLIDYILQGLTCLLIARLFHTWTGNDLVALLAPVAYIVIYLGQRFGNTAQPESYVALAGIIVLQIQIFSRSRLPFFLAGVTVGLLAMTKFSLGILLVGAVLVEVVCFRGSPKEMSRRLVPLLGGFASVLLALALYLVTTGAVDDFLVINRFVGQYLSFSFRIPFATWLNQQMVFIPGFFNDIYSQGLVVATLAGIAWGLLPRSTKRNEATGLHRAAAGSTIYFLLLFLTVVIEGKHFHYHYSRLYLYGAILGSIGFLATLGAVMRRSGRSRPALVSLALLGLFIIVFGPLSRYLLNWGPVAVRVLKGEEAYQTYYATRFSSVYPKDELRRIEREIGARRNGDDDIFVASSLGGMVHRFTGTVPPFKIYHSAFIISPAAPQPWKDSLSRYLLTERPRFIVTQRNDSSFYQSGSQWDSRTALMHIRGVDSLLHRDYELTAETGMFDLYVKR